jgi:Tol biopolymer transport system component/DNA-binding winged helix-turn-helix (wHTH) protein
MGEGRNRNSTLRFGVYQVDPCSGELRKGGVRIRLQEQPLKVLIALLEHPGEVVTREELRNRIWPEESFGDFDHAVNVAVAKLRTALSDSADVPRFVETLHRRGYRFIGSVEPDASKTSALAAVLVLSATAWRNVGFRKPVSSVKQRILTASSIDNGVGSPFISPDGKYLAYMEGKGLFLLKIDSGDVRQLSQDGNQIVAGWFPDGEKLLLQKDREDGVSELYSFSLTSEVRRKILDGVYAISLSHDGSTIAFTYPPPRAGEVWLVNSDGENPRKIAELDSGNGFFSVAWAPGDIQLVLLRRHMHSTSEDVMLETRDLQGHLSATLVTDTRLQLTGENGLCWSQDGRVFYSVLEETPNHSSIWSLTVNPKTGHSSGKPVLVQDFPGFGVMDLHASEDGKRLAYSIWRDAPALYIGELKDGSTRLESVQPAIKDGWDKTPSAWSPDSQSLFFETDRKGLSGLYKMSVADKVVEEILSASDALTSLQVSPDKKWLLFWAEKAPQSRGPKRLLRQPVQGGALETVLTAKAGSEFGCSSVEDHCILLESSVLESGRVENVFMAFDPLAGKTRELTRVVIPTTGGHHFAVSPDGNTIALVFNTNEIKLISTANGAARHLTLPGPGHLQMITWSADSKKLFVSVFQGEAGKLLIAVDLNGHAKSLLENRQAWFLKSPQASPDGRHLAWVEVTSEANVGMLENF